MSEWSASGFTSAFRRPRNPSNPVMGRSGKTSRVRSHFHTPARSSRRSRSGSPATHAAFSAPADAPNTRSGRTSRSARAWSIPTCTAPWLAPPESTNAVVTSTGCQPSWATRSTGASGPPGVSSAYADHFELCDRDSSDSSSSSPSGSASKSGAERVRERARRAPCASVACAARASCTRRRPLRPSRRRDQPCRLRRGDRSRRADQRRRRLRGRPGRRAEPILRLATRPPIRRNESSRSAASASAASARAMA